MTEIRLEQYRQQLLPTPPLTSMLVEKSEDVRQLSQQSQSGVAGVSHVAPSQSVALSQHDSKVDECNVAVSYYLAKHPIASIRDVERETGYNKRTIGRTHAWQFRTTYQR
jgi:hypothetical protein